MLASLAKVPATVGSAGTYERRVSAQHDVPEQFRVQINKSKLNKTEMVFSLIKVCMINLKFVKLYLLHA